MEYAMSGLETHDQQWLRLREQLSTHGNSTSSGARSLREVRQVPGSGSAHHAWWGVD